MILIGNDFWSAYNGMLDSKRSGVSTKDYDVFSDLEESCVAIHQNQIKNNGIKYSEKELEDEMSSFESKILGSTGKDPNYYLSRETKGLKEVSKNAMESDDMTIFDVTSRKALQEQKEGLKRIF